MRRNGISPIIEHEPLTPAQVNSSRPSRWQSLVRSQSYGYGLGIAGLLAWVGWLVFSSRLPALALGGLTGAGAGLRWYGKRDRAGSKVGRWRLEWVALAIIVTLSGLLRWVGLAQSLPYLDNPDEPTLTNAAIKMLQTGDLNPHFFRWPSLPFYLQLGVSLPQFLSGVSNGVYTDLKSIVPAGFFLAGRQLSALFGTATILVTFLLGKRLYGSVVGLLAALTLAVLPLHAEHSHYVTPDVEVTFFATLTLLLAAYIYTEGQFRWYAWAGVAAGLTLGTKYNVGIVLLVVILAHFLTPADRRGKFGWLAASVGLAALTFLVTTPFAVLDLLGFLNEIAFQVRHYTIVGHGNASEGASWSAYLRDFWEQGFVSQAAILALGSVGLALWRQRREDWLMLTLPITGYFFFSAAKVHFARNLLPLLPPLAILSAVTLVAVAGWLTGRLKWERPVRQIGLILVLWLAFFAICLQNTLLTDRYYLQPDTRQQAGQWIVANLPVGARLRMEQDTPILPTGRYKDSTDQRPIGAHPASWYQQQGFDFLVASSTTYDELTATDPEAAANYREIFGQFKLQQEFVADSRNHPGPTIRIYRVK